MAIDTFAFDPATGFKDTESFPDPANTTAAREQLQSLLDQIKTYLNTNIKDVLNSTTDGSSGADNVAATAIDGLTGATVQALLEALKNAIDEVVMGTVPDSSLTDAKLASDIKIGSLGSLTTNESALIDALLAVADGKSGADNIGMTAITETGANATVQSIVEALITRLKAVTDSASGADLIGATAIDELTGATAQALLESLKTKVGTLASLSTTEKSSLVGAINEVQDALDSHEAETASQTELGHVKVDNDTIIIDGGVISSGIKNNYTATTAPTKADDNVDGYAAGSEWINTSTNIMYKCTDASAGDAVWKSYKVSTRTDQVTYGVKIDTTNSNPATALTYTDDAVGFTPATGNNGSFNYGSWQDKFPFNEIKPCLFKNGAVNYYLDPDDYTKKEDGVTASDITSGNDGDVMVEFPKIWWKFETVGDDLYVRYANMQVDDDYKCLAHLRGTTEKDKCYISAYLGYNLSSKLRSLSGKTPTASQTIGAFRTLAQANGTGYDQMAFFQLLMLQVLFIVMFKDRDSQTALGRGYVDGNSAAISTGGTNAKGMFYGETTGKLQNKFCGIEDFWGNLRYWIDGFWSDASRHILIANQSFNDTGSGYTDYGQGASDNLSGYISAVQGTTETGFVVKATAGSETTYYADYGALSASRLPYFGGTWSDADNTGAFRLYATYAASASSADFGSRLLVL